MSIGVEPGQVPRPAEPLHVVVVNDFAATTGGSDTVALGEAAGLARRGHRVVLVAGEGDPARELLEAGVTVHKTGQQSTLGDPNRVRAATQGIWNLEAARLVRETLAGVDSARAVVHVHGFTKVLSASVVRAAVRSGVPVVATLHDYFAACPNGGFFNYQTNEICRLTPLSPRCIATHCDVRSYSHKLWRVGRSAVQRSPGNMPSGVGHLIAPSRFAAEVLQPFLPARAELHVLPYAVPGDQMQPVDPGSNAPFLFLGRLAPDKGPVLFARAARRAGVPAVFAGAGDQADAVRRAYPDAELRGWLDAEELRAAIRRARAVVSPSLWYETQGLSPLEAAAHGVPAVVPDTSVLRDVVADGVTGRWFRGGDVADLAGKLAELDGDPHLTRRLGAAAYERFWSGGWDVETHLDRLEEIYRSAAAE